MPLRTINTPVMNVELTAPRPTHKTPNLPSAGFTMLFSMSFIFVFVIEFMLLPHERRCLLTNCESTKKYQSTYGFIPNLDTFHEKTTFGARRHDALRDLLSNFALCKTT
jgi:hypothetical protein